MEVNAHSETKVICRACNAAFNEGHNARRYRRGEYKHMDRWERESFDSIDFDGKCQRCVWLKSRANFCDDLQERGFTKWNLMGKTCPKKHAASMAQNPDAWEIAKAWDGKENLFFYGPIGVGKTFLARCLLRHAAGKFTEVAETDMRKIVDANRVAFGEQRELLSTWKRVPILLIDDFDKKIDDRILLGALFDLIDDRHGNPEGGRRTIITANASPERLWGEWSNLYPQNLSFTDGIFDRLNPCKKIHMQGSSLRESPSKD